SAHQQDTILLIKKNNSCRFPIDPWRHELFSPVSTFVYAWTFLPATFRKTVWFWRFVYVDAHHRFSQTARHFRNHISVLVGSCGLHNGGRTLGWIARLENT